MTTAIRTLRKEARSTKEARLRAMELAREYIEQDFQKDLKKFTEEHSEYTRIRREKKEREKQMTNDK